MEISKAQKREEAIGCLLFAAVCIFSFIIYSKDAFKRAEKRKAIFSDPVFHYAKITDIESYHTRRGEFLCFAYTYTVNDQVYTKCKNYNRYSKMPYLIEENYPLLIGKNFPILRSESQPEFSYLLLISEDFARYKVPFPDSLSWTRPIFHGKH